MISTRYSLALLLGLGILGACGPSDEDGQLPGSADGGDEGDGGVGPTTGAVYAHSASTLYRIDPNTLAVTVVGTFDNIQTQMYDIAVDEAGNLYGTTQDRLFSINPQTAKTTVLADQGPYPNGLSFVPKGVLDPDKEVLVGHDFQTYVRIDIDTGVITDINQIGGGFSSSGDVVAIKDGATYWTADGPNCNDCLLEIDPATGGVNKNWGSLGHSAVYGLAFWAGRAYGFDVDGSAFRIRFEGDTVTTEDIVIPNAPANLSFNGAGSTTIAPVDID